VTTAGRSVRASIAVVCAFVWAARPALVHDQFRRDLDAIEQRLSDQDEQLDIAFDAIRQFWTDPTRRKDGGVASRGGQNSSYGLKRSCARRALRYQNPAAK
jgi:hypothetical protein